MRKTVAVIAASALLAILPSSARAQDEKKIHVNFGGGPTFPAGDLGNHFNTGWGPAIGVTMDTGNPRFSLQFEYAYRYMGISKNAAVPAPLIVGNTFDANHQTNQLDFNLIANLSKPGAKARIYGLFGPGAYHRKVEITKYKGSGVICDPYWYVCGTYPVNSVIGSRGGWIRASISAAASAFIFLRPPSSSSNRDSIMSSVPTSTTRRPRRRPLFRQTAPARRATTGR